MDRPRIVNKLLVKYPHLKAYVSYIEKENRDKDEQIAQLLQRIIDLEQQVKDNAKAVRSILYKPNKQNNEPKKLGPPENHEPNNRPIPDKVHRKVKLSLKQCPDCGKRLSKPVRIRNRYVEDIRPPEPMNTEYEIPYYWCRHCGKQVTAKPADVIPKCRLGIKTMLLVTFLRYGMLLPYNKIRKQLSVTCDIQVSEGCLVDSVSRFAEYAGPEFDNIKQNVRELAVVHTDWTGWRINGKNTTLWDFVDKEYSLLVIRNSQSRAVVEEFLGTDKDKTVISDCMPATAKLNCKQQKCWVHFLRFTSNLDSEEGIRLHRRLKRIYNDAKSGNVSVKNLLRRINKLKHAGYAEKKSVQIINRLQKYRDSLFTFVDDSDVSDNNNEAERGLRPSVVMRKITGGNRSDKGIHNHEVIMSVMNTWDKQNRDFFDEGMRIVREGLTIGE